ncbi:MAG: Gfo/Idh/MocA family oxidoreductase [Planctomycetes bacterium]|nr:Gfo/Idh/MocA family oxidoreductase [Planctomycetota bacterium]MBM4195079.1 Gfo/Idh/MocA family oxidoreductase [Gemmatimonadota bacterium]
MAYLTRRGFLQGTGSSLLALTSASSFAAGPWRPCDEVRIACVGIRSRGADHIEGLRRQPGVRIVALVDVDAEVLGQAAKKFTDRGEKVDTYADLRQVLDRKDVDAISIATPNHWHALQAIWACQAGKDVYVEKPVSHNIWEGGQLVAAAAKYGRIVQAGTQSRSSHGIAAGIAWLQAGNLGKVHLARGLCYKPRQSIGKVRGPQTVPQHIDYELWTGPAPKRPLARKSLHYDWHWVTDTGNGDVGNQGIHQMDIARWALGELGLPRRTLSVGGRLGYDDDGNTPNAQVVWHEYDSAPLLFEVRGLPRDKAAQAEWGKGMDTFLGTRIGVVMHCEGGTLRIPDYTRAIAFDAAGKEIQRFEGATDHYANFVDAVRSRKAADLRGSIREGHVSSALCHMGNVSHELGSLQGKAEIAAAVAKLPEASAACERLFAHLEANGVDLEKSPLRLGKWLAMDPATERFRDDPAAERLATREYRAGFVVPSEV